MRGRERTLVSIGRYPDIPLTIARLEAKKLLLQAPEEKEAKIFFREARTVRVY